ncbi:MAG: hypothetical protein DLM67_12630 [Candidatus Nephthysia bennettiae]|nr:MAG: hypothetical protein DLM67_12630 [Candidatus Dormibacteraeota bacterium]
MSQWLPYLLVLACPVTMGVMMRGTHPSDRPDARVSELESQLTELRSTVERQAAPQPKASGASSVTADRD